MSEPLREPQEHVRLAAVHFHTPYDHTARPLQWENQIQMTVHAHRTSVSVCVSITYMLPLTSVVTCSVWSILLLYLHLCTTAVAFYKTHFQAQSGSCVSSHAISPPETDSWSEVTRCEGVAEISAEANMLTRQELF